MTPERAAEFLSLLTADTEHIEPGVAAFNRLRREDVTLALAWVHNVPARLLARVKYADQQTYKGDLETLFVCAVEHGALNRVCDIAAPSRWRIPRADFIRDMCRLAIFEHIEPTASLCWRCHGRGAVSKRGKRALQIDCPVCKGDGKGRMKDHWRARMLRIGTEDYRRTWGERYTAIQALLTRYDGIATGGVAKRLAG